MANSGTLTHNATRKVREVGKDPHESTNYWRGRGRERNKFILIVSTF
jgi:hypothetical protein